MARSRKDDKATGRIHAMGGDTLQLIVDYAKQETLHPLKGLGRFIVFGMAGSVALAVGVVILAVALLRVLQGETGSTFTGHWSWAPYLLCTVVVLAVATLAALAVTRTQPRHRLRQDKETP
ncbi:MAG: phage holin family protein [Acidimicrobiales bacterium]